ncbi:unnamed protein product [Prorocentrum cordatum]|uniref:Uncharacterized protein n=1 Tax=Prorocentrum cordatum TaxID=2364126 RepID=A0ABN9PPH4_9DINO|nr:unnamed protein product [Polarella glacialis]
MQAQIRHADAVEERFSESRRALEDSFRSRHSELEQDIKAVAKDISECHDSLERHHQSQQQKQQKVSDELCANRRAGEILSGRLEDLEAKLCEVAQAKIDEIEQATSVLAADAPVASGWLTTPTAVAGEPASAAHLCILERRVSDLAARLDEVLQDSSELHSRLALQEQQLSAASRKVESREEAWHELKERVERGDWDGRIVQLRRSLQEEARQAAFNAEQVTRLTRRLEGVEQVQEQLEARLVPARARAGDEDRTASAEELPLQVQELRDALAALRAKSDLAECAQEQLRARVDAAPRGDGRGDLAEQLREAVASIADQEQRLSVMEPRVQALQASLHGLGPLRLPAPAEDLEQLAREVQRLAGAVQCLPEEQAAGQWASGLAEAEARALALCKELEVRVDGVAAELGQVVRSQSARSAELRSDLEGLQAELGRLKAQGVGSADLQGSVASLQAELDDLRSQGASSAALRSDVVRLSEDFVQMVTTGETASLSVRGAIDRLQAELDKLGAASSALQGDVDMLQADIGLLKTGLPMSSAELRRDVETLQSALQELKTEVAAAAGLETERQQRLACERDALALEEGVVECVAERQGALPPSSPLSVQSPALEGEAECLAERQGARSPESPLSVQCEASELRALSCLVAAAAPSWGRRQPCSGRRRAQEPACRRIPAHCPAGCCRDREAVSGSRVASGRLEGQAPLT